MVGKFAQIAGIVFVAVGLLGFVPQLVTDGKLLSLFPINGMHNAVHILLGLWGLSVAKNAANALTYAKGIAVIYAVLAVLGLIPATNTLFGLAPIGGLDVGLHAVLAIVAGYFGFGPPSKASARATV